MLIYGIDMVNGVIVFLWPGYSSTLVNVAWTVVSIAFGIRLVRSFTIL